MQIRYGLDCFVAIAPRNDEGGGDVSDPFKSMSRSDLYIITHALNEICNGGHLDEWDFETRMGVDRETTKALLERVGQTYRERFQTNDND